jgi:hypothetical protein
MEPRYNRREAGGRRQKAEGRRQKAEGGDISLWRGRKYIFNWFGIAT